MENTDSSKETIWRYLAEITDPEIPVINIVEMGIVRAVEIKAGSDPSIEVHITPTYFGCPAMHAIESEIITTLKAKGFGKVSVKLVYAPAWSSAWLTEEARQKLKNYGIAPPCHGGTEKEGLIQLGKGKTEISCPCPYCDSTKTELRSEFGSTACKAMYYCNNCEQPFEYFKSI